MDTAQPHQLLGQVKKIKTSEIRKMIPQECYGRSSRKTFSWFGLDLLVFVLGMLLIFFNSQMGIKFIGALISGTGAAMMFLWAHDAAHGTLFKNKKVAEVLGTIFMLPSLNIYRLWSYGHNKVHHGFTSFSPIDWIWRPLTPKQYQDLSVFQRMLYRIERNSFTCAFHYLRQIWWAEMLRFNPGKDKRKRQYYRKGKFFVLIYAVVASTLAYYFAGGITGIITVVIIPFIVFNYFIAMVIYLHHTHPDIPLFDVKEEWSRSVGILYCSTIVHCSKISKMLLHNIMMHIPHHLDIHVPFYHLPQAYQALKKEYGDYFHEYHFKWGYVYKIFKQCKLYDFEKKLWLSFKEVEQYQEPHHTRL